VTLPWPGTRYCPGSACVQRGTGSDSHIGPEGDALRCHLPRRGLAAVSPYRPLDPTRAFQSGSPMARFAALVCKEQPVRRLSDQRPRRACFQTGQITTMRFIGTKRSATDHPESSSPPAQTHDPVRSLGGNNTRLVLSPLGAPSLTTFRGSATSSRELSRRVGKGPSKVWDGAA
jgi:hypothetical protein